MRIALFATWLGDALYPDVSQATVPAAVSGPAPAVPRVYRTVGHEVPGSEQLIEQFVDRLVDYKATVHRTDAAGLVATLSSVLTSDESVVVPPGLPADWRSAGTDAVPLLLVDGESDRLTPHNSMPPTRLARVVGLPLPPPARSCSTPHPTRVGEY